MSGGQVVQYRFTPTCVGKMDRPPGGLRRAGRFTPTCVGKIVAFPSGLVRLCGSPPRAWGKSVHALLYPFLQRFTPTCVGKMTWPWYTKGDAAVHPHVRGENPTCIPPPPARCPVHPHTRGENGQYPAQIQPLAGSPPHAWGKFRSGDSYSSTWRFTPTRVGKIEG